MANPGNIPGASWRQYIRPSRLWYWLAGGLLAAAALLIALAVTGFISVDHQVGSFQRVPVPGQGQVTIAQPGAYILYIEQPGRCCSVSIGSGQSPPFPVWSMRVLLQPAGGGVPLAITTWHGAREVYNLAGHEGQTAMTFRVAKAGRYVLRTGGATPATIADLAVGRDIGRGTIVPLILFLAGVLVLTPAGITTGLITFFRRRGARRRLLAAQAYLQPPGPGGWQPSSGGWRPPPGGWEPPPGGREPQPPP